MLKFVSIFSTTKDVVERNLFRCRFVRLLGLRLTLLLRLALIRILRLLALARCLALFGLLSSERFLAGSLLLYLLLFGLLLQRLSRLILWLSLRCLFLWPALLGR